MSKHSKRYDSVLNAVEEEKLYTPPEAIALAKKNATAKFDETIELHLRTGADPRHADQMVRGVSLLPHGVGKEIRTLVFCQGESIEIARTAGSDHFGSDDVIAEIEKGWLEFDVSIATPDMMGRVGKLGPILGRKGLMPNPRTGTVVSPEDIPRAVEEAKKGRVEFKLDRSSIIHVPVGKASFDEEKLMDNLTVLMDNIIRSRPSGLKGQYVKSAFITTTMGPSIAIDVAGISALKVE